jgi:hypothetical protein
MTTMLSDNHKLASNADLDPAECSAVRRALGLAVLALCLLVGGVSYLSDAANLIGRIASRRTDPATNQPHWIAAPLQHVGQPV